jgi:D-glycero-D-manno-heptose 1,7-bisphosphate phosphatase
LRDECRKNGSVITDVYFSPHHDDFGKSLTRKPGSLLIERALYKYDIDPSKSYMIGDKQRDVDCGEAAGVKGILIDTNAPLRGVIDLLV